MGLQREAEHISEYSQWWGGASKEDTIPAPYSAGRYKGKLGSLLREIKMLNPSLHGFLLTS